MATNSTTNIKHSRQQQHGNNIPSDHHHHHQHQQQRIANKSMTMPSCLLSADAIDSNCRGYGLETRRSGQRITTTTDTRHCRRHPLLIHWQAGLFDNTTMLIPIFQEARTSLYTSEWSLRFGHADRSCDWTRGRLKQSGWTGMQYFSSHSRQLHSAEERCPFYLELPSFSSSEVGRQRHSFDM